VAVREAAQEFFKTMRASHHLAHFTDFAHGEFFPARTNRSGFTNAAEECFDFGKREPHFACEFDEENAIERFGRVAALATAADGGWEQADFFVIANGGRV